MDEELQPVFDAIERHEQKFGVAPVFDGLHPKIGLVDWYLYEIDKAIRENKPLNMIARRDPELNNPGTLID